MRDSGLEVAFFHGRDVTHRVMKKFLFKKRSIFYIRQEISNNANLIPRRKNINF